MKSGQRVLGTALAFYAAWVGATWFFEGRIQTLLRPDAVADRIVYAFAVNLLFGIAGGVILLRTWIRNTMPDPARTGFLPSGHTAWSVAVGFALGLAAYLAQGAPSLDPVVVVNAFAQVFVVSAAEVVVCWAVVGVAAEAAFGHRSSRMPAVLAAIGASILFGLYHYAHSAPFNTWPMVVLLSAVGLVTSAFFYVSRDVAGTIVFHNFLGTFGVVKALADAGALHGLEQWQPPLLFTAGVSAALIAVGYSVLGRAARRTTGVPSGSGARRVNPS